MMQSNPTAGALEALMKNLEARTPQTEAMLQRFLLRVLALDARTKDVSPDLVCFCWDKCPSLDHAFLYQQQCDEQANRLGLVVVQKLNKVKKSKPQNPEDLYGHYYTRMIVGFNGLMDRACNQIQFFEEYANAVKALHTRQSEWRLKFEMMCIDKHKSIRDSQYNLRDSIIQLIKNLSHLHYERHGLEMDRDDINHLLSDYDMIERRINSSIHLETLVKSISNLKQRFEGRERKTTLSNDRLDLLNHEIRKQTVSLERLIDRHSKT